jgi:hypothetical protein
MPLFLGNFGNFERKMRKKKIQNLEITNLREKKQVNDF